MEKRRGGRQKKRVTCELEFADRQHRGIVLDVSPRGLFVQTDASPAPGESVNVELRQHDGEPIRLQATVARKRLVPRHLSSVASRGIGLEVRAAPEAFYRLMGREREPSSTDPQPAPAVPKTREELQPRFRVRVKQQTGPRSRSLLVNAGSKDEARRIALAECGSDWAVLDVEEC